MNVRIVKEWSDLGALASIEKAASERYRTVGYDPSLWPISAQDGMEERMAAGLLWVAVLDDRAVGFAMANDFGADCYLDELDVVPELHGRGIGKALVAAVLSDAKRAGRARVTLLTFRTTAWSVGLYRRMGFAELPPEERPAYLRRFLEIETEKRLPVEDRISMEHALEPGA